MAIESVLTDWRTNLQDIWPNQDFRFLIDPRQQVYPDVGSGSPTFSLSREANLIDRGNCESTTAPMMAGETSPSLTNATFARSADYYHGGNYSYKFTKTIAAGTAARARQVDNQDTADMHGFVAGQKISKSAWVFVPSVSGIAASEIFLQIIYYQSSTTAWNYDSIVYASKLDEWEELSLSVTLPSDTTGVQICVGALSTAANAEYFYVDDIIVKAHTNIGDSLLTGGYTEHLVTLPDTGTLMLDFIPTFAYDVGSGENLFGWYIDATHYFVIYYYAGGDRFRAQWIDGGTSRYLESAQYDDGTSYRNINQRIRFILTYDLTTGSTAGSALWLNKTQDDAAWNGSIDAHATTMNKLQLRAYNGSAGAVNLFQAVFIPNRVVTDAEVQADLSTVYDERIVWDFNGHATGRTWCQLDKTRVLGFSVSRQLGNPQAGQFVANTGTLQLRNHDGAFSDDQYAAFDPTANAYNGTVYQKYLQARVPVRIEHWYDGDHDIFYTGRVDAGFFKRKSQSQTRSLITLDLEDAAADFAKTAVEQGTYWENKRLASLTASNSLITLVGQLASKKLWKNYIANSSFENATIANSWTASGGTLTREADPFYGSYCGQLANASGDVQNVHQVVTFTGSLVLNVGENWTAYIWIKCADAAAGYLRIYEYDGAVQNDYTEAAYSLDGGEDYVKVEVTHVISDSTSDRLRVYLQVPDGVTLKFDECHLIRNNRSLNFIILNDNDGSSGVESADDADSASFETIGYDLEEVTYTHRWRPIFEGASVWESLKQLAVACGAMRFGISPSGSLRLRCVLNSAYSEPIPAEWIDGDLSRVPIGSNLTLAQGNHIIGHADKIRVDTRLQQLWRASQSGWFDTLSNGILAATLADGDYFPDPSTYGELWAPLAIEGTKPATPETESPRFGDVFLAYANAQGLWARLVLAIAGIDVQAQSAPEKVSVIKARPREPTKTIIGVQDPWLRNYPTLTQTTFDTTSRPGSAHILVYNGTGGSVGAWDLIVLGKPVFRIANAWINDNLIDREDIARNGERPVDVGNGDVTGIEQLTKLCEWQWKFNRNKKHVRNFALDGCWGWLEPGQWTGLTIGAAGETENISEIGEPVSIDIEVQDNRFRTQCLFREVEERLAFNNNIYARMIAAGVIVGQKRGIVVAASDSLEVGDVTCTGTDDQDVINAAIQALADVGGGQIVLLPGHYYTSAEITPDSDITLSMYGAVIVKNGSFQGILAEGGSGTELSNINILGGTVTRDSGDTSGYDFVKFSYVDDCVIRDLMVTDCYGIGLNVRYCDGAVVDNFKAVLNASSAYAGLSLYECANYKVHKILVSGGTAGGVVIVASSVTQGGTVSDVRVNDVSGTDVVTGIVIQGNKIGVTDVSAVGIATDDSGATPYARGIQLAGTGNVISNIHAVDVNNTGTAANAVAITIYCIDSIVSGILADTGTGTGILVTAPASRLQITAARSTGFGTMYTDSGSNTNLGTHDWT